ncbi:MAG: lipopolysaccharide biosynthesis protein [Acidobacteria bacterium]|nr:MAG: lipopolysaccharide biosynthesis protein [Acidobacteriota bacterium]
MPTFGNCTGLAGNTRFCNLLSGQANSERDSQGGWPEMPKTFLKSDRGEMVVQRELSVEDWLAILRRRFWWLLIPAILCAVAGFLLSLVLPKRYTSHTRVLVEAPIVPDSYVKPVVSDDLNRRLASMQGEILSRTRLQHLVEQFGLYKDVNRAPMEVLVDRLLSRTRLQHPVAQSGLYTKDVNQAPMEVLVDRLQKSIEVTPLAPTPGTLSPALLGFNIDVTLGQAKLSQQVCTEITSLFMEQNLHLREQQAEDTTQFLAKQLDDAKAKLDEQDTKLAAFQSHYVGAQPGDEQTNLTLLAGLTPQLEAVTQGLNQAQQTKAFAESMLTQQLAAWKSSADGRSPQTLQQQLSDLENQLPSLQARYTDKHPAVLKLKEEIAQLQKEVQDVPSQDQGQSVKQEVKAPLVEPLQIQQLRAQLHQADLTVSQKKEEQKQLQQQIKTLQARIQLSPMVQQEFKALTRDYQTALNFYNELLKKRDEAQMATELERRQQGENFRMLDPPSFPEQPSFPNRGPFALGGLAVGLGLGAGLAYLVESRDKSLRKLRDVEVYLGVPTLAVIPSMESGGQRDIVAPLVSRSELPALGARRASVR